MELLFKREQTLDTIGRVNFKLWGKVELDEEEQALVSRYKIQENRLITVDQPYLVLHAFLIGLAVSVVLSLLLLPPMRLEGVTLAIIIGAIFGLWYFQEKRETIYVKDLLHGRYFKCRSVVELAKKEASLEVDLSYLRQVLESAKHWDGTERVTIEPLPKDEAKQAILRGA